MEYRQLGKTGLNVSRITLGTAELGLDYGFRGAEDYQRPEAEDAIRVVHRALDLGINIIDAGRVYGTAEELVGKALNGMSKRPFIASKVRIPDDGRTPPNSKRLRRAVFDSIETSLKTLRVDAIDLMYIHNATSEVLKCEEALVSLEEARRQGKVRFLGASCYGEPNSLAALQDRRFQVLQVPFNFLDLRMRARVFPRAAAQGVGILTRSTFLRGVLTSRVSTIPSKLAPLREAALSALAKCGKEVTSLAELALRFSLSLDEIASVIIGVRSTEELESNLSDAAPGALPPEQLQTLLNATVADETLVDVRNWADMI